MSQARESGRCDAVRLSTGYGRLLEPGYAKNFSIPANKKILSENSDTMHLVEYFFKRKKHAILFSRSYGKANHYVSHRNLSAYSCASWRPRCYHPYDLSQDEDR